MSDTEVPSSAPSEKDPHAEHIAAVRTQLQGLQEAIASTLENKEESIEAAATKVAEALKPLAILPEAERTQAIQKIVEALLGDFLANPTALDVLRGIRETQDDLATLKKSITTADIIDEASALKAPSLKKDESLVGTAFEWMDYIVDTIRATQGSEEEQPQWMSRVSDAMKSILVGFIERLGSLPLPMLGNISLLNASDERVLAERRFVQQEFLLTAKPTVKQQYNEAVHKPKWIQAYKAWVTNQKNTDMPTLETVVTGNPVSETQSQTPILFAGTAVERAVTPSDTLPLQLPDGTQVRVGHKKVEVSLPTGNVQVALQDASGKPITIDRIIRASANSQNTGAYTLASNASSKTYTVEALVSAVQQYKSSNNAVLISGTDISVVPVS